MKTTTRIQNLPGLFNGLTLRQLTAAYNDVYATDYTPGQFNPLVQRALHHNRIARYLAWREGKPPVFVYFLPSYLK